MRHLRRRAQAVSRLYRRLDLHTRSFRLHSGLRCPAGCGRCCLSPEVEATALEMLPAAFHLLRAGRLEQTLEQLASPPRTCLMYLPQPAGHCGLYDHRPLVCRLFGFSAALDAEGRRELVTCRLIRAAQAQAVARAEEAARGGGVLVPLMPSYTMELYGIDPSLGARPLPINLALAQAVEMVGLGCTPWSGRDVGRRAG